MVHQTNIPLHHQTMPALEQTATRFRLTVFKLDHKNNTTFYTTTLTTLSGITYGAQIANALNGGSPYSPSTRANMLAVGNIIAFQTEAGNTAWYKLHRLPEAMQLQARGRLL